MDWYEDEVRGLERSVVCCVNGTRPPVFYGSSSMRLWTTLNEDVPGEPRAVNLGFGGSTLEACNFFFDRLVVPVHPRSLVVYAGDNDLGDGRSVQQVVTSFKALADKVGGSLGDVPFGFISVKPSPARFSIIDRIRSVNELIRRDIKGLPRAFFVDVFSAMEDENGHPRSEYFTEDGLHMNRAGYYLWAKLLEPYRNQIFTK